MIHFFPKFSSQIFRNMSVLRITKSLEPFHDIKKDRRRPSFYCFLVTTV